MLLPQHASTVERLCALSRKNYRDPYSEVPWPEAMDEGAWYTSPELISLYGTPRWEGLSEDQRRRLSFFEAVNFYSLNINGEKALMEGLVQRLYDPELEDVAGYLHHFLDEENKHSTWFGTFCHRFAGKIYRQRRLRFEREYAPGEEHLLFFAKVALFEELVDQYNVAMAKDERLAPIARWINQAHHDDESRHLAFGRLAVKTLVERYTPTWSEDTLRGVRDHLLAFLRVTWKEYYNPQVYRDAGLADPFTLQREAFDNAAQVAHREATSGRVIKLLVRTGLFEDAPAVA